MVMFWVNQKYWQESGVPLASFGVLLAGYGLIAGLAGRSAALGIARYGRRPLLAAVGVLPSIAYFGMASFLGWGGILLGILAPVETVTHSCRRGVRAHSLAGMLLRGRGARKAPRLQPLRA